MCCCHKPKPFVASFTLSSYLVLVLLHILPNVAFYTHGRLRKLIKLIAVLPSCVSQVDGQIDSKSFQVESMYTVFKKNWTPKLFIITLQKFI